jgi:hypothetical protein
MYHSITCRPGNEYGREQTKLTVQRLTKQMVRLPVEFSMYVTLVIVRGSHQAEYDVTQCSLVDMHECYGGTCSYIADGYGFTSQKTVTLTLTAVRTLNLIRQEI